MNGGVDNEPPRGRRGRLGVPSPVPMGDTGASASGELDNVALWAYSSLRVVAGDNADEDEDDVVDDNDSTGDAPSRASSKTLDDDSSDLPMRTQFMRVYTPPQDEQSRKRSGGSPFVLSGT